MPVIITFAPTSTATVTTKKVYRFVVNSGHEIVTITSAKSTITVAK